MGFFLMTFLLSVLLAWFTFTTSPRGYYAPVLLSITSTIQIATTNLLINLDPAAIVNNVTYLIQFRKVQGDYVYACIFFQLIILTAVCLNKNLFQISSKSTMKDFLAGLPPRVPRYYASFGLLFIVLYPFNEFLPPVVAYFMRLLLGISVVSPILAGFLFFKAGRFFNACWVGGLVLFTIWSFTIGSRGHATLFWVYYAAGLLFGAPSRALRRRILIASLFAIYPFTVILGAVGAVRDQIGRVSTADISQSRIDLFFNQLDKENTRAKEDRSLRNGVYRLVNWANPAVIYLSPEKVEYRYFGSVPTELLSILDISLISGKSPEEKRKLDIKNKLGTAAANDYGFRVTEANSVEFGILADGWSRMGPSGLFIVAYIMVSLLLWAETLIMQARMSNVPFAMIAHFYFLSVAFSELASVPAIYFIRDVILNLAFIFLVTSVTKHFAYKQP